jgi:hypothetical protein
MGGITKCQNGEEASRAARDQSQLGARHQCAQDAEAGKEPLNNACRHNTCRLGECTASKEESHQELTACNNIAGQAHKLPACSLKLQSAEHSGQVSSALARDGAAPICRAAMPPKTGQTACEARERDHYDECVRASLGTSAQEAHTMLSPVPAKQMQDTVLMNGGNCIPSRISRKLSPEISNSCAAEGLGANAKGSGRQLCGHAQTDSTSCTFLELHAENNLQHTGTKVLPLQTACGVAAPSVPGTTDVTAAPADALAQVFRGMPSAVAREQQPVLDRCAAVHVASVPVDIRALGGSVGHKRPGYIGHDDQSAVQADRGSSPRKRLCTLPAGQHHEENSKNIAYDRVQASLVQGIGNWDNVHACAPMIVGQNVEQQIDSGVWDNIGQSSPQRDVRTVAVGGAACSSQDEGQARDKEATEAEFVAYSEPCTASVLFGPVKHAATALLPTDATDVRSMHVAVCGHWHLHSNGQAPHLEPSTGTADGNVTCEWCAASVDGAVLAARALQRLAMLHICHWQLATLRPADVGVCSAGIGSGPCSLPHLPIHFALALRGLAIARVADCTGTRVCAVEQTFGAEVDTGYFHKVL